MSDQTDMNRGFLKDKLGNYRADPPEKVWNEISGRIGGGRSRRGLIFLLLASAASLALVISLGIHYWGPDLPATEALTEEAHTEGGSLQSDKNTDRDSSSDLREPDQTAREPGAILPVGSDAPAGESTSTKRDGRERDRDIIAVQRNEVMEDQGPNITISEPSPMPLADTNQEPGATQEPGAKREPGDVLEGNQVQVTELLPEEQSDMESEKDDLGVPVMEEQPERKSRWMLGAALSPLYSYRDAETSAIPGNPAETGLLSYSTGVHVSYRRNSRLAIETGVYYNRTGLAIGAPGIQVFSQNFDHMVFGPGSEKAEIKTVINSVGNIIAYSGDIYMNNYKINAEYGANNAPSDDLDQISTAESGIQQHLDFLELPFNLRYSVIDRTFELQLVGGVSTNFLVNNSVTMETSSGQEEIGYLSDVRAVNYSGNAGLGMIYHIGKKISLTLEPRFRYFINSVNESSLPSTRPYSVGLYTGLSYTF
jgi:hypothetical protein